MIHPFYSKFTGRAESKKASKLIEIQVWGWELK
jgi:hypothetical protein